MFNKIVLLCLIGVMFMASCGQDEEISPIQVPIEKATDPENPIPPPPSGD